MMWVSAADLKKCQRLYDQHKSNNAWQTLFVWQLRAQLLDSPKPLTRLELIQKWLEARGVVFAEQKTDKYPEKIDIAKMFCKIFEAEDIKRNMDKSVEITRGKDGINTHRLNNEDLFLTKSQNFLDTVEAFLQKLAEAGKDSWLFVPKYGIDQGDFEQMQKSSETTKGIIELMRSPWAMGLLEAFTLVIYRHNPQIGIETNSKKCSSSETYKWITANNLQSLKNNTQASCNWKFAEPPFIGRQNYLGNNNQSLPSSQLDASWQIPPIVSRITIEEMRAEMKILRSMTTQREELGATDSTNKRRKIGSVPVSMPVPTGQEGKQEEEQANIANEPPKSPRFSSPTNLFRPSTKVDLTAELKELQKLLTEDVDEEKLKELLEEIDQEGPRPK